MKTRLLPLIAFTAFAAGATASFADTEVTGTIAEIEAATHTIVLTDGSRYVLSEDLNANQFKVGDTVTLTWIVQGTDQQVESIAPAG